MIEGVVSLSACSSGVPTDLWSALNVCVCWGGGATSTRRAPRQVDDTKMKQLE